MADASKGPATYTVTIAPAGAPSKNNGPKPPAGGEGGGNGPKPGGAEVVRAKRVAVVA